MIKDIRRKIKELPITVTGRHIKGHQDKHKEFHELDRWSQLNVKMDSRAKALLRRRIQEGFQPVPQEFGNETLPVYFQGRKLSRFHKPYLYEEIYGKILKDHWAERHSIGLSEMELIDWKANKKAMGQESHGKRRWLCKHLSGHCAVGRQLKRRHWQKHSNCPRCNAEDENTKHVLQCPDVRADNKWRTALDALDVWMVNTHTNPHLMDAILSRLYTWRANLPHEAIAGPTKLQEIIAEQDSIGWENFFFGRITSSFAEYQQTHFSNIKKQNQGKTWVAKLIRQLWLVMRKMWDHRNKINKETVPQSQKDQLNNLRRIVRQEFAAGTKGLLPEDKELLQDKEAVMNYDLRRTQDWVNRIDQARECSIRTEKRQNDKDKASRRCMQRFLAMANPIPTQN